MKPLLVSVFNFTIQDNPSWPYLLTQNLTFKLPITSPSRHLEIRSGDKLIGLWQNRHLTIMKGYACDGATCWPDHQKGMCGFFFHDFCYQLGKPTLITRAQADAGMNYIHQCYKYKYAWLVLQGVKLFGWMHYGKKKSPTLKPTPTPT